MSAQRENSTATAHRVVVLGAGYAGVAAAVQLAARVKGREGVQVSVVNAQERFTERMRLHMTATGQRLAELSIPELLEGTGAQFVRGWVTAMDADAKTVRSTTTGCCPTTRWCTDWALWPTRRRCRGARTMRTPSREHVRARRPRFAADRSRQREATERFFAAATGGDVNALMELLSPDATLWTDGGGKVRQALRPVVGATTVAAWVAAIGTVTACCHRARVGLLGPGLRHEHQLRGALHTEAGRGAVAVLVHAVVARLHHQARLPSQGPCGPACGKRKIPRHLVPLG
ncbi:sigma-70 family RNA polymerase sigma factor family protein [Streptomyces acidicola]|uniref:hypothetical protein n=1 Tax=Streptomyces acidicola TaxID=2596892 RepID=UPI001D14A534|nr:hypothetical protein [Streptomyces acidicola]